MTIEEAGSPNRREGRLQRRMPRSSERGGSHRIVPASKDWTEQAILTMPPDDSEPFFQECRTCYINEDGMELMLADDGVLHKVRICTIKFRDVEAVS